MSPDATVNGARIRQHMLCAAQAGARLVHFSEAALSGYATAEIDDWATVDWPALGIELQQTAALAARLGLWVVLGANRRLPPDRTRGGRLPQNCLYVISDRGEVAGRYAKRLLSNTELTYWYTPGTDPLVFDVDGIRFGCALCIEVVFPHLFTEYERLGATCVLLSAYSADPVHGLMAQAHAATNGFWLSLSTPVACSTGLSSALVGPDGREVAACQAGIPGMVVQTIDPASDRYKVALRIARPWRARARSGELHRSLAVPSTSPAQPIGYPNKLRRPEPPADEEVDEAARLASMR